MATALFSSTYKAYPPSLGFLVVNLPPDLRTQDAADVVDAAVRVPSLTSGKHVPSLTLPAGSLLPSQLVQELLRHATVAMTLDTYSHCLPSMGDATGSAMGGALG